MSELSKEHLDRYKRANANSLAASNMSEHERQRAGLLAHIDALAAKLAAAEQQLAEATAAFDGLREWQHNELPKILRKNSELVEAADANFAALIIEHRRMCKDRDYRREKGFNDGFLQQLEKEAAILEPFAKGKSGRELVAKVDILEKQISASDEFHNGLNDLMNGYDCPAGTEKLPWIAARLRELDEAKQQLAALRGAGDVDVEELAKTACDAVEAARFPNDPQYRVAFDRKPEHHKQWLCNMVLAVAARVRAPLAARVTELEAELKLWRPMTDEEAEASLDEAVAVPISDEEIKSIVSRVTDPTYRPTEPQHVLMAAKIEQLKAAAKQKDERIAELERQRDDARALENRLSTTCVEAISRAGVSTPEEGYLSVPSLIASDVGEIAKERDALRTRLADVERAIKDFDVLPCVNAATRWPDPPKFDDRWSNAVCGAADRVKAGILAAVLKASQPPRPDQPASKPQRSGGATVPTGANLIAIERRRQIEQEGWDAGHDDEHDEGEIARAAACYAAGEPIYGCNDNCEFYSLWPWDSEWDKRKTHGRLRQLVIAGALVAAEIDRLLRMPQPAITKSDEVSMKPVESSATPEFRCPDCGGVSGEMEDKFPASPRLKCKCGWSGTHFDLAAQTATPAAVEAQRETVDEPTELWRVMWTDSTGNHTSGESFPNEAAACRWAKGALHAWVNWSTSREAAPHPAAEVQPLEQFLAANPPAKEFTPCVMRPESGGLRAHWKGDADQLDGTYERHGIVLYRSLETNEIVGCQLDEPKASAEARRETASCGFDLGVDISSIEEINVNGKRFVSEQQLAAATEREKKEYAEKWEALRCLYKLWMVHYAPREVRERYEALKDAQAIIDRHKAAERTVG